MGRALRSAGLRDEDVTVMAPGDNRCLVYDVIVALGDEAFRAVMNHIHPVDDLPDVREARGYIWPTSWGKRCIPSMSLRDIEKEWVPWRVLLDLDMQKAAAEAAELLPPPTYSVTLITSVRDAQALFEKIRQVQSGVVGSGGLLQDKPTYTEQDNASRNLRTQRDHRSGQLAQRVLGRHQGGVGGSQRTPEESSRCTGKHSRSDARPLVALDIENHEDMTLACLGVALDERSAFVLPTPRLMAPWQRSTLATLCALNVPKVFQNGGYDRYFLRKFYDLDVRGHAFDTMLAWHALQPELAGKTTKPRGHRQTAKSLRFLASIYTRAPFWKDYDFKDEMERYELCARDCCVTLEVANKMREELDHA